MSQEHPIDEFKRIVAEQMKGRKPKRRRAPLKVRWRAKFWAMWWRVRGWWITRVLRRKLPPCASRIVAHQSAIAESSYSMRVYWVDKNGNEKPMPPMGAGSVIKVDGSGRVIAEGQAEE